MKLTLHQTHHQIADFAQIREDLISKLTDKTGLHLFSELFLSGYPLNDLCLQSPFIHAYEDSLEKINTWSLSQSGQWEALLGGLKYHYDEKQWLHSIYNVIYVLRPGKKLEVIYTKQLLPNYDIFDEQKYFTKGTKPGLYEFQGKTFGLFICEDMWASTFHHLDPAQKLWELTQQKKKHLDGIINLSASPFDLYKDQKRVQRATELSQKFSCPFFYLNRVGGEDEILFDGASFVINHNKVIEKLPTFKEQGLEVTLPEKITASSFADSHLSNTWESLFNPQLDLHATPPRLIPLDQQQCQLAVDALCFGFQEYAKKNNFKHFTVALSGGIDSSLVLTLIKKSLLPGQTLEAIFMASQYSSSLSYDLSKQLCQNLGVKLTSLPIKFHHSSIKNSFFQAFPDKFEGLTDENVQSRLRGLLLYTRSNQIGSMITNTSNKSEIAVGYSTQYGDSVGAISLLGDLYKSEVYQIANDLNQSYSHIIPEEIIKRAPTAELRENQKDQDSLPPYERLDAILEAILSYRLDSEKLTELGHNEAEVKKVYSLLIKSEYKRKQFCPILKIKPKSFGYGYRVPITIKKDFI